MEKKRNKVVFATGGYGKSSHEAIREFLKGRPCSIINFYDEFSALDTGEKFICRKNRLGTYVISRYPE